jgi:hypothetical protein
MKYCYEDGTRNTSKITAEKCTYLIKRYKNIFLPKQWYFFLISKL